MSEHSALPHESVSCMAFSILSGFLPELKDKILKCYNCDEKLSNSSICRFIHGSKMESFAVSGKTRQVWIWCGVNFFYCFINYIELFNRLNKDEMACESLQFLWIKLPRHCAFCRSSTYSMYYVWSECEKINQCAAVRVICPEQTEGQTRRIYLASTDWSYEEKKKVSFCDDCCAQMEKWQLELWSQSGSLAMFATFSVCSAKQHFLFGRLSYGWNFVAMDLINTGGQNVFDRTASS